MPKQTEVTSDDVLKFWLDECTPADWYKADDAFDSQICDRFEGAWQNLCDGHYSLWLTHASGALAYIILADQFPRNMFRGQGKAFASDRIALAAAKSAVDKGWDLRIAPPARQFFYVPMMHSENLCDQERCVRLMCERMDDGGDNLLHARAHREVIRKFGRFPYRNDALGRSSTSVEQSYVQDGGYSTTVNALEQVAAA